MGSSGSGKANVTLQTRERQWVERTKRVAVQDDDGLKRTNGGGVNEKDAKESKDQHGMTGRTRSLNSHAAFMNPAAASNFETSNELGIPNCSWIWIPCNGILYSEGGAWEKMYEDESGDRAIEMRHKIDEMKAVRCPFRIV